MKKIEVSFYINIQDESNKHDKIKNKCKFVQASQQIKSKVGYRVLR
jgi:hypothetical protein